MPTSGEHAKQTRNNPNPHDAMNQAEASEPLAAGRPASRPLGDGALEVTREGLVAAIRAAWNAETTHPAYRPAWTPENAALGQCAATSLVVYHYFGGAIVRGLVDGASHYWNRFPEGDLDLTRGQFRPDAEVIEDRLADPLVLLEHPDTRARALLLHDRVRQLLNAAP